LGDEQLRRYQDDTKVGMGMRCESGHEQDLPWRPPPDQIGMFLYAVKAEGYNVEIDNVPLDKCGYGVFQYLYFLY
jgi:hypothetical protein